MKNALTWGLAAAAFAAGLATATYWPETPAAVPEDWLARIGDRHISVSDFVDEMRLRGGAIPGQYRDPEQKRALLDAMLYRQALVAAAEAEGLDAQPDLRRAREQLLADRYLRDTLRRSQEAITVSDEEVARFHGEHAEQYSIPARRRVAMIHIPLPPGAAPEAWARARELAAEAIEKTRAMNGSVPHFGEVAREYSHDSASRYRGGVIGWIAEGQAERYRYDPVLLEAAYALEEPGALSGVLDGNDGVYVARLVELEPRRERGIDELAAGIRQRLLRERQAHAEDVFRQSLLTRFGVEVRDAALDAIDPLAPPAVPSRREPPAMPRDEG